MIDIEDMLKVCLPGGNLCDPQMIADDIRAYVERAQKPSATLPTEPGLYWWRCTGGATWYLVEAAVSSFGDKEIVLQVVVPDDQPGWLGHSDWSVEHGIGQWLPWLPPASPNPPGKLMSVHDGWRVSDCGQYIERVGDGKWIVPVGVGCQMLHEDHGSRCWDKALEGAPSVKGALYRMSASESEVQP